MARPWRQLGHNCDKSLHNSQGLFTSGWLSASWGFPCFAFRDTHARQDDDRSTSGGGPLSAQASLVAASGDLTLARDRRRGRSQGPFGLWSLAMNNAALAQTHLAPKLAQANWDLLYMMKFASLICAFAAVLALSGCLKTLESSGSASATPASQAPAKNSQGYVATQGQPKIVNGYDCSVVPRSKSEIAEYREKCL